MSIFKIKNDSVEQLKKQNFRNEKELQTFVEQNMENLFGVRFLASEFTTSQQHGGRIDSLGLDENNSPVIIEYKWGEKDNIINQGLFYLDWLVDHKGDFQLLVQNKLGDGIKVDFGSPRVLLVAQTFNKYDQYAINRMAENIELWGYSRYENNVFELKLIASSQAKKNANTSTKITKINYKKYSIEDHLKDKSKQIKQLFLAIREKIFALESEQKIEESPRKLYIAYRATKTFARIQFLAKCIDIYFTIPISSFDDPKKLLKDLPAGVKKRGVYSYVSVESFDEVDDIVDLIKQSYLQSI